MPKQKYEQIKVQQIFKDQQMATENKKKLKTAAIGYFISI